MISSSLSATDALSIALTSVDDAGVDTSDAVPGPPAVPPGARCVSSTRRTDPSGVANAVVTAGELGAWSCMASSLAPPPLASPSVRSSKANFLGVVTSEERDGRAARPIGEKTSGDWA